MTTYTECNTIPKFIDYFYRASLTEKLKTEIVIQELKTDNTAILQTQGKRQQL